MRHKRPVFTVLQSISKWHTHRRASYCHWPTVPPEPTSALLVQRSLQHSFPQDKVSLNSSPAVTPQTPSEVSSVHTMFDQEKKYVCFGCKQAVMQSECLLKCRWKMQRLWIRLVEASFTPNAHQARCSWYITTQSCKEVSWLWGAPGWFCSMQISLRLLEGPVTPLFP